MRALAIQPGRPGLFPVTLDEPQIDSPSAVKLRVLEVGICGTDREEASGGRSRAPEGADFLVIGHEMLGEVVAIGSAVTSVKPGDLAVLTVRRGCGKCLPCGMGRDDMCRTGKYRERGIWGLHGYQCEFVMEDAGNVIPVPPSLRAIGVLCEPLSIVEKGIVEAIRIQHARLPDAGAEPAWPAGRRCLVAGLGPVGLLAAMALRLRGAAVTGIDVVPAGSPRPAFLAELGGDYVDIAKVGPEEVAEAVPVAEMIFEAAGVSPLAFGLLEALAPGGIHVVTGIPGGNGAVELPAGELLRRLVLNNQLMFGSVNAAAGHFRMAVADLEAAVCRWKSTLGALVTHRYTPEEAVHAISNHSPEEIKGVVEW